MRKFLTSFLTILLAVSLNTACGKKDEKAGGDKKGGGATAKKGGGDEKGGIKDLAAPEFFKHYQTLKGMEVMDHYGKGVVVNGTVKRTIEEMDGSLGVWLEAGGDNWVSLKFKDKGAAAKAKAPKAGDPMKASCQVGGAMDKYIMCIDCELE